MNATSAYRLASSPIVRAHHQPALLLDFAGRRGVEPSAICEGTGVAAGDLGAVSTRLTPDQYLRCVSNLARAVGSPDASFLLGQELLPGHYGAASHALLHARNLREALTILVRHEARLVPLLAPRLVVDGALAALVWIDSYGAKGMRPFLTEMHMASVASMARWLSGERLPWTFCFNRARPRHAEQHEVHLGPNLRFDCHVDAILMEASGLDRRWPRGHAGVLAASLATARLEDEIEGAAPGVLCALYDHLVAAIRQRPDLESASHALGVSPATLKRHLAQHGTHFQAELDLVRTHVALLLMHARRFDNEAVASYLGFHDATNFRRSFKRWTGLTPALLRQSLPDGNDVGEVALAG
jgi:AraC-like DNA-binding protein